MRVTTTVSESAAALGKEAASGFGVCHFFVEFENISNGVEDS
jgi:hypothetical protein